MSRREHPADIGLYILGIIMLVALASSLVVLVTGCSSAGAENDCARVRSAIDAKLATCETGRFSLDCSRVQYEHGDVDACLRAIEEAQCSEVDQAYLANCNLFGYYGL